MLIAITGSNGNVGKRVVLHALRAGHTVRGIDHVPPGDADADDANARFVREHAHFAFVAADLRDYAAARDALRGADAVAQLAAFPNPGDGVSQTHNR
jgi:nucleoside-diphosphate-sugar epimerase